MEMFFCRVQTGRYINEREHTVFADFHQKYISDCSDDSFLFSFILFKSD